LEDFSDKISKEKKDKRNNNYNKNFQVIYYFQSKKKGKLI
jgi:hypothetical protein